ncbi:MAG TPA: AbrB/MazE/SpoVT family DNA-binding domain-containing protein [Tepidiformaceae bacterium]|nr:AbrB/MazE/SpoVT family DNA-binding domain-containing protein [Tepidiformaceae bacterium]
MGTVMKVGAKGQVTIPQAYRERFGIDEDTEVEFEEHDGRLTLHVREGSRRRRLERMIERMSGTATAGLSTDEIMRMTRGEDWQSGS